MLNVLWIIRNLRKYKKKNDIQKYHLLIYTYTLFLLKYIYILKGIKYMYHHIYISYFCILLTDILIYPSAVYTRGNTLYLWMKYINMIIYLI
jgi:hypothetical protein